MAYEVARFHHEKWNGKGYPEGLSGTDIPLCARIMAVADVFDAVSEKRCYRDAMPMDQCFDIIAKGSGEMFDPIIADTFVSMREKVEKVRAEFADEK
jgi:response regulator RpfG family c-di-GMP phosphodiesterase